MTKAGKKMLRGAREALRAAQGDPDVIRHVRVTPSCGCVFCDLKIDLHEDAAGFHHLGPEGQRIDCAIH